MVELHSVYAFLFAVAAAIGVAVASVAWRHRAARGALPLAAVMLGVAIWSAASAAMWSVPTFQQQLFWLKVTSLGTWMIPFGFLALAFDIAGMDRWRTPGRIALMSIPPFALANIEWLNPGRLYDRAFIAVRMGPHTHYTAVQGPLYWAFTLTAYAMIVVGFVIIIRVYRRSHGVERTRARTVLIGALLPFVASAVSESRLVPLGGLDLGPLAFVVTGTVWLIALMRGQLLDILPLARDALVEQMSDGVVVIDGEDLVVDTNPAARSMLHVTPAAALGEPAEAVLGGISGAVSSLHDNILGDAGEKRHAAVPIRSGRDSRYVELGVTALKNGSDGIPAHLVVLHDVTAERRDKQLLKTANRELKRNLKQIETLKDKLQEQAIRDPLTSLYNRRFLSDTLPREMARAERQAVPVTFVLLDIDEFKLVNDAHSHSMGDAALKMVGEVLLASARVADIVCRYGGDEFLAVMPDADTDIARARAEDIRKRIEETPVVFGRGESAITVSIGVSSIPANGVTADDGIAAADSALHHAKESGRNRTAVAAVGPARIGRSVSGRKAPGASGREVA